MAEPRQLTAAEYEEFVSILVRKLSFWKNGRLYRNKRYPGVRQPGEYEIDIAIEVELDSKLFFRLIIECKNWSRPVTRPVVQQLAQTRDAIGAHKAAVASPVGFSKEAVEVAQACGIALWVMAMPEVWDMVMAMAGFDYHGDFSSDYFILRSKLYTACIIATELFSDQIRLVEGHRASRRFTNEDRERWRTSDPMFRHMGPMFVSSKYPWVAFGDSVHGGSAYPAHLDAPGYDTDLVETQLVKEHVEALRRNGWLDPSKLRSWRAEGKLILQACGVSADQIDIALDKVIADDEKGFREVSATMRKGLLAERSAAKRSAVFGLG